MLVPAVGGALPLLWVRFWVQAADGLVAHWTHASDLQPLQKALLMKGVGAGTHPELVFGPKLLQTHGARLT